MLDIDISLSVPLLHVDVGCQLPPQAMMELIALPNAFDEQDSAFDEYDFAFDE